MDFSASLDYLYGLQRFGIKLGLETMRILQNRLSLRPDALPCVHVAGTNGKGSVSAVLAEILKHSGLRTGLYTSPHLHCFTERIRLDGEPLSQEEVALLANRIREVSGDLPLTFFEATTAMALLAFQEQKVDIAVIETGLGGRLDATNIVEPLLTVITPVSHDHTEHLGETLAEIAREKAGILKAGVPVVISRQPPEALAVLLAAATDLGARVCLAERDFCWHGSHEALSLEVAAEPMESLSCSLAGRHQLDNFAQAVAAALQLRQRGWPIPEDAIRKAGRTTIWPGRLEWWGTHGKVLLDVAHNRAGIRSLAAYLDECRIPRIELVVGLSGERAPEDVLEPLANRAAAVYAVPLCYGPAVATSRVAAWATGAGLPCVTFDSACAGLTAALQVAPEGVPVVVCGSLYLVAELRQKFLEGTFPVTAVDD